MWNKTKKTLLGLIDGAKELGLGETDLNNAREYIDNGEFALCFDIIVTQMYENDIEIKESFFQLIRDIAEALGAPILNCLAPNKVIVSK